MDTEENKSIPFTHPSHSGQLPKTIPVLFFFFFILSSRNWPRTMTHQPVKCSLCCCFVVSSRQSLFSLSLLPRPEQTHFLMKRAWKQKSASYLVDSHLFFFQVFVPTSKWMFLPYRITFASSLWVYDLYSPPCSGVRKKSSLPQTGAAGTWSWTTYQAEV